MSTWFSAQLPVCIHLTPRWAMQHQFRELCSHMGIFLSLSTAHCPVLHCDLSLSQSFQALLFYFPWQKYHIAFSILLLISSVPCSFVLALDLSYLCTSSINSVHGKSIQHVIHSAQKESCEVLTLWDSPCFLATVETSPHVWSTS